MKNLVVCALFALAVAGCAKDTTQAKIEDHSKATQGQRTTPPPTTGTTTPQTDTRIGGNELTDPRSPLSKRSVYFDFDSNEVKDEYRGTLQAHSRYIADHRDR